MPPEGLQPVLTLKTQIIFLKDFEAGAPVGYEGSHVTRRRTRVATLPVGYNDGYPWSLSGKGEVLVRGHRAPVVGRISMDYLMVDVGRVPGVSVGDEVVLIGASGDERVTVRELADRAGTIQHEILTRLGKRIVRTFRGGTTAAPEGLYRLETAGRLGNPARAPIESGGSRREPLPWWFPSAGTDPLSSPAEQAARSALINTIVNSRVFLI